MIQEFNDIRSGRFTSSGISDLCSNGRKSDEVGAPFYSLCDSICCERFFGTKKRGGSTLATEWGKLAEVYVSNIISKEGITVGYSDSPILHNDFKDWWCGTPDGLGKDTLYEIKCPFTIEEYSKLYGCTAETLKLKKKEYYWQMVSNCIITNKKYAELVAFYPNKHDLEAIRDLNRDGSLSYRIEWADESALPCLGDGKDNLNFYRMRFEVSEDDKVFLTERVKKAIDYATILLDSKHGIL